MIKDLVGWISDRMAYASIMLWNSLFEFVSDRPKFLTFSTSQTSHPPLAQDGSSLTEWDNPYPSITQVVAPVEKLILIGLRDRSANRAGNRVGDSKEYHQ